ncbi:diguanylate cyclase [Pseudanabaena sp. PCC 6802]|uniref:diguanylate cyclase n=1 Tax=Pseudanabaena sp. PCC 6802 TaxID=118173 RepID=UPI00034A1637|nr:diguanylate cyclase [Pseudanabaena sp. PCC 6802]
MEQDVTACLHDLVRLATYACQVPTALITIFDGEILNYFISFGLKAKSWYAELPFCTYARRGSSLFVVEDASTDSRFAKHPLVKNLPHIKFYAGMPLIADDGRAIGTFCVVDYLPRMLSTEQKEAIALLAQQAVMQVQRHNSRVQGAKLETLTKQVEALQSESQFLRSQIKDLEWENDRMQLLYRLGMALQTCSNFEKAYQAIAPLLPQLFPDCTGNIFIGLETHWNIAHSVLAWGEPPPSPLKEIYLDRCQSLISHPMYRQSCLSNASSTANNPEEYCLCCHQEKLLQDRKLLCFPLNIEDNVVGVLHLYPTSQVPWTEERRLFVEKVVNQLTIAFGNLKVLHTFKLKSIRDHLTGLFNRRYFEEILERLLNRGEQGNYAVSLIVLDIDYFKNINDTFGHLAGDAVLRDIGIFLKGSVRPTDIACRYGGEEFAIVLPACPIEIAGQRAEKLRRGIQYLGMEYQGQSLGKVTISGGVAAFPDCGSTLAELVSAADTALYQAKVSGRNRICISNKLTVH